MNSLLLGSTSCPIIVPLNQRSSTSQDNRQGSQRTDSHHHTPVVTLGHCSKGFFLQSPGPFLSLALISCSIGVESIAWGALLTDSHRAVIEGAGASNAMLRARLAPPAQVTVDKPWNTVSAVYGKNWGRHRWRQHSVLAAVAVGGTGNADPQGYVGHDPWLIELEVDESAKITVGAAD